MQLLPGFIQNAALLLVVGLLLDLRTRNEPLIESVSGRWLLGIFLGAGCVASMLVAVPVGTSGLLDSRGLILALAGLFFGALPTAVAVGIAAAFRYFVLGGIAAPTGVALIIASGAIGCAFRAAHKARGHETPHWGTLLLMGAIVSSLHVYASVTNVVTPDLEAVREAAPALIAISAFGTWLTGLLLEQRLHRAALVEALADREERYREIAEAQMLRVAALNAAVDAIAITDTAGRLTYVNPAFETLTGFSADEALGKTHKALVHSGHQGSDFYRRMWSTLLSGQVWTGELINRRKDGAEYTEEQTITPVKDANGEITHFIAIKRDITHRKQLEHQLNQAHRIEGIGRLAGGVAHDFNNLLTVMNGTVELAMARKIDDAVMAQDLKTIGDAVSRGAKLTRQLLAVSRQQVLQPTVVDLNAVVREMNQMLSRLIGERTTITLHLQQDLARIRADAGQLGQVLMNLVVNARDAMPDGGEVVVTTANKVFANPVHGPLAAMPPGRYVTLDVADTGTGMDADTKDRIFEPFFTTKAPGKGTGLGLPTAYGIVKQSGGFIWLDSAPGKGTTFHLAFPIVSEEMQESPSAIASGRRSGETAAAAIAGLAESERATETILLVEDEDAIRRVATRVLASRGYTVLAAASGEEALQHLEQHRVDLMLSDMVMPGMNGPELAVAVRERQPGVKVLFTSGYSREAVDLGIGDAGFIAKPYGLGELILAVRSKLGENRGAKGEE